MADTKPLDAVVPILSGKVYDRLKWVALIALPALASFYLVISGLWELGYARPVVGTIVATSTFLGALLQLSTSKYNRSDAKFDGDLVMDLSKPEEPALYRFELNKDIPELADKGELQIKVKAPNEVRE